MLSFKHIFALHLILFDGLFVIFYCLFFGGAWEKKILSHKENVLLIYFSPTVFSLLA